MRSWIVLQLEHARRCEGAAVGLGPQVRTVSRRQSNADARQLPDARSVPSRRYRAPTSAPEPASAARPLAASTSWRETTRRYGKRARPAVMSSVSPSASASASPPAVRETSGSTAIRRSLVRGERTADVEVDVRRRASDEPDSQTRRSARSSIRISWALWMRSRGLFSRQRPTIRATPSCTSGRSSPTGLGWSFMIEDIRDADVPPCNGRLPVAIS